jgi:hypothetical protein
MVSKGCYAIAIANHNVETRDRGNARDANAQHGHRQAHDCFVACRLES